MQSEGVPGGFAQVYRILAGFEEAGHCRRGYVIEKLGAAQFAASATVDRLREFAAVADPPPLRTVTLAATDPANPYGAALGWPALEGVTHRPGRKAGGLVVLVDGELTLYLERGGRSALAFTEDEARLQAAARDLAETSRRRRLDTLTVEQVNGEFVYGTAVGRALREAGFVESPRGLTLRRLTAGDTLREAPVPEGDTVHRAAAKLSAALAGREVTRFDIRVPGSATADLRGETVHEVVARGKHLLERIGAYTLHSHLKMEGRWDVYRPGERWRRPAFKARAIVGVTGADTVGFDLAMVEVLPTADEDRVVGHLGPDLLGPDWNEAEAVRRVSADTRAAHVALLDQRNVAVSATCTRTSCSSSAASPPPPRRTRSTWRRPSRSAIG